MRADYQGKRPARLRGQTPASGHRVGSLAADLRQESFRHFADLRRCFRSADQVRVASGNPVVVFNVHGNNYRLICALHYHTGKVFLLRFLTHAEYSKDRWKDEL